MQFRTKARAVDLLGKGQIADLPTAITELWKNGYDAYADNLKAELYISDDAGLQNSYFVISDDGKGMSHEDILNKWLVLGTDSKSRADLEIESEETLWKRPRIKAGEKGIGRLSVAYLGNPMLMLTKKIGHPIQALYFDWRLLENYNLFLEDIQIPLKTVEDVRSIEEVFSILKDDFLLNLKKEVDEEGKKIWEGKQNELKNNIITETAVAILEKPIKKIILQFLQSEDSHGTMFLTFNAIDQILDLSEKDEDNTENRDFVISSLTGFTNPFKSTAINIKTKFEIHKGGETYDLLNSKGQFFSKSDFDLADVYIKGLFDGHGNFEGKIRIYDETINYNFISPRRRDKRNYYGQIPIELGYSQGEERSSNLNEIQFDRISEKVKEYGGLYIYRDDFRVLPYGRQNADFLGFEERRSRRAGTYYFSYRRMFGYLDLKRKENPDLKDKSSREGLINNAQYRAFTSDAINFFKALALDYFATDPKESIFINKKKEINEQFLALKADRDREKVDKIAFTKSLNKYPLKLDNYKKEYTLLLDNLEQKLNNNTVNYSDVEDLLANIQQLDAEYKTLIPRVPKRYKPTETQMERLYGYEEKLNEFISKYSKRREALNHKAQERLEIKDLKLNFIKKFSIYSSSLEKIIIESRNRLKEKLKGLEAEYDIISKSFLDQLNEDKIHFTKLLVSKEQVPEFHNLLESKYQLLYSQIEKKLLPLVNHIEKLTYDIDEDQVQGAYKAQYEQMKYQWDQTRDTAQLGIAVEIIDHEFNQIYAKINNQLDVLALNNDVNEIPEFNFLEKNFKQLEDKYALLSPLYRISGASPREISCKQLFNYLNQFFEKQIQEYDIELRANSEFLNHAFLIKEPVIYTVFINIVNNAIYWMRNKENRIIEFRYFNDFDELIISNSGEKIPEYRLKRVFDLFYSQRPNGRGIGLYLAKQSLNEAGLDLYATNEAIYNNHNGASFVISKLSNTNV